MSGHKSGGTISAKDRIMIAAGLAPSSGGKPIANPKAEAILPRKLIKPRSKIGIAEAKSAAKMTIEEWRRLQAGMAEQWPQPEYMKEDQPGCSHMKFRDQTYSSVTRWLYETRIEYRPHAKAPGTKSHVRYERYSQAKTVGEALKLGSWPLDWCWDLERGFIKIIGPSREEPLDISKVADPAILTEVDMVVHKWYVRELAKNLGLDWRDLLLCQHIGESTVVRAHRLVAQRDSHLFLEQADKEKRRVRDEEVQQVLEKWAFAKNPNRTNVIPTGETWVFSDTLGLVRDRVGSIHLTVATLFYPSVTKLFTRWLYDRLPREVSDFRFSSINVNCNYAARLHRDGNNVGPSCISAFGNFTGGELHYYPEDDRGQKLEELDPKESEKLALRSEGKSNLCLFNGNSAHAVSPFEGSRYSIVFFTVSCHAQATEENRAACNDLGIKFPFDDDDPFRHLRKPAGYTGKGGKHQKGYTYRLWKAKEIEAMKHTPFKFKTSGAAERIRLHLQETRSKDFRKENDNHKVGASKKGDKAKSGKNAGSKKTGKQSLNKSIPVKKPAKKTK